MGFNDSIRKDFVSGNTYKLSTFVFSYSSTEVSWRPLSDGLSSFLGQRLNTIRAIKFEGRK
jgi:hypothetical protein